MICKEQMCCIKLWQNTRQITDCGNVEIGFPDRVEYKRASVMKRLYCCKGLLSERTSMRALFAVSLKFTLYNGSFHVYTVVCDDVGSQT